MSGMISRLGEADIRSQGFHASASDRLTFTENRIVVWYITQGQ
jgi:hypothetical protein